MALTLNCDRCKAELNEPGALVFSPPDNHIHTTEVDKFHICKQCWLTVIKPMIFEPEQFADLSEH